MSVYFLFSLLYVLPLTISSYKIQETSTTAFFVELWKAQKIFKDDNGTEYVYAIDVDQPVNYGGIDFYWKKTEGAICSYRITPEIRDNILDHIVFNSTDQPTQVFWSCQGSQVCSELGCMSFFLWLLGLAFSILMCAGCCFRCCCACPGPGTFETLKKITSHPVQ